MASNGTKAHRSMAWRTVHLDPDGDHFQRTSAWVEHMIAEGDIDGIALANLELQIQRNRYRRLAMVASKNVQTMRVTLKRKNKQIRNMGARR